VLPGLLGELMRHPYLRRRPPKTTGREMFGVEFAEALYKQVRRKRLGAHDLIATATAFTAASIAGAYRRFLPQMPQEVIVCGGGSRNPVLVEMLRRELPGSQVRIMDELGINADAKEALSFALLAVRTIRGQAGNVPSATGAKGPAVLGKVVLAR
jgi:anhydro-N-acetylmuramic acid kinase